MITIELENNPNLVCGGEEDFTIKLNSNATKLEVYRDGKFLGNFVNVIGIDLDEFFTILKKKLQ